MSSENKSCTPKLRFPGFTGEWASKPLSFFLHEHRTKSDGKCEVHSVSVSKGVINQVEYLGRSFAAADTSKYNLAKPNDIIYTKSPTGAFPYGIVKQNKNPYNVIVSPLYAVYTPINKFVGYILDSFFESAANTNSYLESLIQKGAKNTINISNDTFVSKAVCLPLDPAEQEKIATFLSEIDALISAQDQKVERLKVHKKGLMQQLFPQPGETKPRLRFPEFSGEWEEKTLGSIAKKVNLRNSKMEITRVLTNSANSGIVDQNDYFDRSIAVKENTANYHIVDINEFVYNPRISSAAPVGPISINKIGKGIMSPLYTIFRFHTGCVAFYEQYFQTTIWHPYLKSIANFGARFDRMNITSEGFFNMPLYIPSYAEQRIIADFLSNFDSLISDEEARLESLKDHKKGLMQQLFPTPSK
ncbi:hypothetical protein CIK94_06535 [Prevotella sp. P4-51]|uniref:restriction endonuclease subunit S n=1 Tax=Prevotella sp. P4-51 TaxID=2024228 RepID=UPI000B961FEE|nr:restriction endonuclease subunit S [Prevotella sp. P4-51]OYP74765.1 hypothetical protein CIK94_06535 [Prevotella sp. P4-51]